MPNADSISQLEAWKNRLNALRDFPKLWALVWDASPGAVAAIIALRVLGGVTPLGMLYAAKFIFDIVVSTARSQLVDSNQLCFWVSIEFALSALTQLIGRAVDFFDTLVADRFSLSLGLKIMRHAATLDLQSFEDPQFHDRLERARAQSTDRMGLLTSAGWLLQRMVRHQK